MTRILLHKFSRLVDYIDKLVPNTDEHTILEAGSTKLLGSCVL